ncbi:MAG: hypothetical protein JW787_10240 [Sedimentisphaerales bacterium]|nr:hypothetical protein [Sedimentisphaerales bacterium]
MVKTVTSIYTVCFIAISLLFSGCKKDGSGTHYFELIAAENAEALPNGNFLVGWIRASENSSVQIIPVEMDEPYMYWVQWKLKKTDINFDGYTDIGVFQHGGAKWGRIFFWLYDPETKQFYRNSLTEQISKLTPDHFWTDPNTKQIKITEFYGTTLTEYAYQFNDGHLNLIESSVIFQNGEQVRPMQSIPRTESFQDTLPPNIDTCPILYNQILKAK